MYDLLWAHRHLSRLPLSHVPYLLRFILYYLEMAFTRTTNFRSSFTVAFMMAGVLVGIVSWLPVKAWSPASCGRSIQRRNLQRLAMSTSSTAARSGERGRVLVLGGTGFLGQTVCRRALLEGYAVTSLSRRGIPPSVSSSTESTPSSLSSGNVSYRSGDARKKKTIAAILDEGGYVGK